MTHILIGVDGSDPARAAVRYVGRLAARNPKLRVDVTRVLEPLPVGALRLGAGSDLRGPDPVREELVAALEENRRQQEESAREVLKDARATLVSEGVDKASIGTEVRPCLRSVARTLLAAARDEGYRALVVGRRGVSMWNEYAFGGVTEEILRHPARHPVWVVEGSAAEMSEAGIRILVGVDGSDNGLRAVKHAAGVLGPASPYTVTLACVTAKVGPDAEAERALVEARRTALEVGFPEERLTARSVVDERGAAAGLLTEAARAEYSTIVIGRRGHSAAYELLWGGVTERLLRYPTGRTIWVVE